MVRITGRPDSNMTLDVLSVLSVVASPGSVDPAVGGEDATPSPSGEGAFSAVFAQWMGVPPQGQDLADPEGLAKGLEAAADQTSAEKAGADSLLNPLILPASSLAAPTLAPQPQAAQLTPSIGAEADLGGMDLKPLGLHIQALGSGQMQLITPSQPGPELEVDSLMQFAQGQGLDASAMERLFGQDMVKDRAALGASTLPAAAWLAAGQRAQAGMAVQVVVSPDTEFEGPFLLASEKFGLGLSSGKAALAGHSEKPLLAQTVESGVAVSEDGRVELDLDLQGMLTELGADTDLKSLRADERVALSLRIGEMLAQRMLAQAQRGQWQLRFALNPQNLGRVEIDMQMRGGELEATFAALNPATRDLLQDALPRLKEMLQQSGMDVASLNIGSGGASKNGGQPTPQTQGKENPGQASGSTEVPSSAPVQQLSSKGADGWDIWV